VTATWSPVGVDLVVSPASCGSPDRSLITRAAASDGAAFATAIVEAEALDTTAFALSEASGVDGPPAYVTGSPVWSLCDVAAHPASAAAMATQAVSMTAASAGVAVDPIRFGTRHVMDIEIPHRAGGRDRIPDPSVCGLRIVAASAALHSAPPPQPALESGHCRNGHLTHPKTKGGGPPDHVQYGLGEA
jgi:hypothetical protein